MRRDVVRVRTAPDEAETRWVVGIDDVMDIAGVVALEDAHGHARVGVEPGHALGRQGASSENDDDQNDGAFDADLNTPSRPP